TTLRRSALEIEARCERHLIDALEQHVRSAEIGATVRETGVLPFVEVLASQRQIVRHLSLGRYLTDRQEDFLGFDAGTGHGLHPVGGRLRVGNRMCAEQQALAPVIGVATSFQVDRRRAQAEVGPDEGIENLARWTMDVTLDLGAVAVIPIAGGKTPDVAIDIG